MWYLILALLFGYTPDANQQTNGTTMSTFNTPPPPPPPPPPGDGGEMGSVRPPKNP